MLDLLKTVRLLGGLGVRIMGITHTLRWELRQSVEADLGCVLQSILSRALPICVLPLRSDLRTIGIEVRPGGNGCVMLTDIDLHKDKGLGYHTSPSRTAGVCIGNSIKTDSVFMRASVTPCGAKAAVRELWSLRAADVLARICTRAPVIWADGSLALPEAR